MNTEYIRGEMTEEEIFNEFLIHMRDKNRVGTIITKEWLYQA